MDCEKQVETDSTESDKKEATESTAIKKTEEELPTLLVNLPSGGQALLFKQWLPKADAQALLEKLRVLPTKKHDFRWHGHALKQTRMNWACGDAGVYHEFGGVDVPIHEWTPELLGLRQRIVDVFDVYCNFCLLNHYRDGKDAIAPHSDGELYAKKRSVMTLSTGITRKMQLLEKKTGREIEFDVEHGDLFVMWGDVQQHWKHGIREEPHARGERISLTFRSTLKRGKKTREGAEKKEGNRVEKKQKLIK